MPYDPEYIRKMQERKGQTGGASPYTPETFDMGSVGVGGNRNYFADPNTRKSWEQATSRLKSGQTEWRGGQYGYTNFRKFGGNSFTPFQIQPKKAPLFATNPAAYRRNLYMTQQQEAMDEAKRQTEERFEEAKKNLENVGVQEGADINTRFNSARGNVNQSLVSSGLAGTSVLPSMQRGVERERTGSLNRLATMLAREKNQLLQSRSDIPPDLALYAQLMRGAGSGGY